MKTYKSIVLATLLICGCSTSSHIIVGNPRPPIKPSEVRLYLHPPTKYDEIALLDSDSNGSAHATGQGRMDAAIKRLKKQAAKLGANGILLTGEGNQNAGSVGFASGTATASGSTTYGSGIGFAAPIMVKQASGIAIYVIEP